VYIGGGQLEVMFIHMGYFGNWGKTLYIEVGPSSIWLFVPSYASAIQLPSASIESDFEMRLRMRLDSERIDLENKGIGELSSSTLAFARYIVELGITHITHIRYGVEIPMRDIELNNVYTQFFAFDLAPVSVLL